MAAVSLSPRRTRSRPRCRGHAASAALDSLVKLSLGRITETTNADEHTKYGGGAVRQWRSVAKRTCLRLFCSSMVVFNCFDLVSYAAVMFFSNSSFFCLSDSSFSCASPFATFCCSFLFSWRSCCFCCSNFSFCSCRRFLVISTIGACAVCDKKAQRRCVNVVRTAATTRSECCNQPPSFWLGAFPRM